MKQRLTTDNNDVVVNIESIEVQLERKLLRNHRWLRLVKRFRNKIYKKLLLIGFYSLFIFSTVCILFYLGNVIVSNKKRSTVIDADYVLPIDTATDKDYYIIRPNGRDDGGVVRVMFAIASNRTDQTLCYAVASAYFTNIPIVVVGYKTPKYTHVDRHYRWMEAANAAKLEEHDILMKLDADIMFTGLDYLPFLDKFIKLSPANLNELDAKAVRTGEALPPVLYASERGCYAPQVFKPWGEWCSEEYSRVYTKHNEYVNNFTEFAEKPFINSDDNKLQHLNGGTSIQRVWAMRKLFSAFTKYMASNKPLFVDNWWEDQSVFTKLYLELRVWEIEQDYFSKSTKELRTMYNNYGLYAGLIGLDFKTELSGLVNFNVSSDEYELTTEHWETNKSKEIKSINVFDENKDSFVRKWYNKTDVKKVFTQRKLTRSYSNVHSVTIAPPLLSVIPRHINGKDKPAERVFPLIMHFAGAKKEERVKTAFSYMQWSLPMMFDKEEWKRGKQYTMSMPIDLWTYSGDKLRLQYSDVCEKFDLFDDIH